MNQKPIIVKPPATIHLVGICGTGMGALAGLLTKRGYKVTGSDSNAYPPMSDELEGLGIIVMEGYKEQNLQHNPDLVVVGNVCKIDHPEAVAAKKMNLECVSMAHALHDLFLTEKKPLVVAGTHGKTTTTALLAYLLEKCGKDPSVLVGGITQDFGSGYKLGEGPHFVIEGDEYDSAYFEKRPKFLSYAPSAGCITSVEHDHIDIYPTADKYFDAFTSFAELVGEGPLAVYSGDEGVRMVVDQAAIRCPVITYGVKGDPFSFEPAWYAKQKKDGEFKLLVEGLPTGIWKTPLMGRHNLRNTLAALIIAHRGAGVDLESLKAALPGFGGIARRQQLIGTPRNINVYDDFAHHPTAVAVTLDALRTRHPEGRLVAAFEPRSATACRKLHQTQYSKCFGAANQVVIAPVGRDLPEDEVLDTGLLASELNKTGITADSAAGIDEVQEILTRDLNEGDTVVLFSNGAFGGLHKRLLEALSSG